MKLKDLLFEKQLVTMATNLLESLDDQDREEIMNTWVTKFGKLGMKKEVIVTALKIAEADAKSILDKTKDKIKYKMEVKKKFLDEIMTLMSGMTLKSV